jgi:hypothetical protein
MHGAGAEETQVTGQRRAPQNSFWNPPAHAAIKINANGAYNLATGEASIESARDHEGNPHIMVWRMIKNCRDAEEIEAIACLEGLHLAQHWPNNVLVELELDCANVVTKVNNNSRDRSVISAIICDIKKGMMTRGACLLRKIWREQNRTAHNLAQFALKSSTSRVSYFFVPFCILDLVYNDRYRCGHPDDVP